MKIFCIFAVRHTYFDTLRDSFSNSFCEDNPVGPVPFLTEGIGTVSQPPRRALLFHHIQMRHRMFTKDITPYRERSISQRPTIPARVREFQDRIIHGELIHRRRLLASRMEAPICSPEKPKRHV